MGLFDKAKIDQAITKAKELAEKNKDTITGTVTKATAAIDGKTGGKYSSHLKKVDDATHKYLGTSDEASDAGDDAAGPDAPEAAEEPGGNDATAESD